MNIINQYYTFIVPNYNRDQLDEYFTNLKANPYDEKYIITCLINLTVDNIASLIDIVLADDFDFSSINELDAVINTYNYYLFLLSYLNKKLLMAHRELSNDTNEEKKDNDQIRIVFSIGTGNNYIIKGVFQKKEDTYRDKYVTVSKRPDAFKDSLKFNKALEYSKERFEIMINFLERNARKSNRC